MQLKMNKERKIQNTFLYTPYKQKQNKVIKYKKT